MAKRVIVTGKVQGVCFRSETKKHASALGLVGYAKNRADGSLEVVLQGNPLHVQKVIRWIKEGGPVSATVETVHIDDIVESSRLEDFLCYPVNISLQ